MVNSSDESTVPPTGIERDDELPTPPSSPRAGRELQGEHNSPKKSSVVEPAVKSGPKVGQTRVKCNQQGSGSHGDCSTVALSTGACNGNEKKIGRKVAREKQGNGGKGNKAGAGKKRKVAESSNKKQDENEGAPSRKRGRKGKANNRKRSGTTKGSSERNPSGLPPVRWILFGDRSEEKAGREEWSFEEVETEGTGKSALPHFKELQKEDEKVMSIANLKNAAKKTGVRKAIPIEQHCFTRLSKCVRMAGGENEAEVMLVEEGVKGMKEVQAENERLCREVLALRGEIVVAHCERDENSGAKGEEMWMARVENVNKGIRASYMATQASWMGFSGVPAHWRSSSGMDVEKDMAVACCKDGLEFIWTQMTGEMGDDAARAVGRVFASVHVRIVERLAEQAEKESGAKALLGTVCRCVIGEVKRMLESVLGEAGGIDVMWSRTIVVEMVVPLWKVLKGCFEQETRMKEMVLDVYKMAARGVAEWEADAGAGACAARRLGSALEVSLGLAVWLKEYVLEVPRDVLFVLARRNAFFADVVVGLECEKDAVKGAE